MAVLRESLSDMQFTAMQTDAAISATITMEYNDNLFFFMGLLREAVGFTDGNLNFHIIGKIARDGA